MQVTRTIKRQPSWSNYGNSSWTITISHEEMGYKAPSSPEEVAIMGLIIMAEANRQVCLMMAMEGVIVENERAALVNSIVAAAKEREHKIQHLFVGNTK